MYVRIREGSLVGYLAAKKLKAARVAIVFGNTIFLYNTCREDFLKNTRWVRHELKHVEQYQRHGFVLFLQKYLIEYFKKGYYQNRFEVEARNAESIAADTGRVIFI